MLPAPFLCSVRFIPNLAVIRVSLFGGRSEAGALASGRPPLPGRPALLIALHERLHLLLLIVDHLLGHGGRVLLLLEGLSLLLFGVALEDVDFLASAADEGERRD